MDDLQKAGASWIGCSVDLPDQYSIGQPSRAASAIAADDDCVLGVPVCPEIYRSLLATAGATSGEPVAPWIVDRNDRRERRGVRRARDRVINSEAVKTPGVTDDIVHLITVGADLRLDPLGSHSRRKRHRGR